MTDATGVDHTPTADQVFTLNPMYRMQWEEAQSCYVLLYPEGMIQLNGPAGEIMSAVDGERTVQDIIDTLSSRYPDVTGIGDDILEFLGEAHEQRWISL